MFVGCVTPNKFYLILFFFVTSVKGPTYYCILFKSSDPLTRFLPFNNISSSCTARSMAGLPTATATRTQRVNAARVRMVLQRITISDINIAMAARFDVIMPVSLWNLTGISAATAPYIFQLLMLRLYICYNIISNRIYHLWKTKTIQIHKHPQVDWHTATPCWLLPSWPQASANWSPKTLATK